MKEIEQNFKNQNQFLDFEFLKNTGKPTTTSKQLHDEYVDGLDSVNFVTTVKILKLKVEYLLSQDIKYQKAQSETTNKVKHDDNKQLDVENQRSISNLKHNLELSQFMPHFQISKQQISSP